MKLSILAVSILFFQGANAENLRRRANTVCTWSQIREFDCDIRDDVVGVYVCRRGATTCVDPGMALATDTCGCCAGDNRPDCIDDGDSPAGTMQASPTVTATATVVTTNATAVIANATAMPRPLAATETGICSAFQLAEFDCDIADDVVGVYVCRGGTTTCVLATNTMSTDTCGCCPGDTRPECIDDGDRWVGDQGAIDDDDK